MSWTPALCMPCEYRHTCVECLPYGYIPELRQILLKTDLFKLWKLFEAAIVVSPFDTDTGYNLMGLNVILQQGNYEFYCTQDQFWDAMIYFLARKNKKYLAKKKSRE